MPKTSVRMIPLLLLLILAPSGAFAEWNAKQDLQFGFSYGDAELKGLYDQNWEGESLDIAAAIFEKNFGIGLNYQFVDAEVNEPALSGRYTSNGLELLFYLTHRSRWLQPYAGVGAGVHYNSIEVTGRKTFEKEGFGGRLVGKAGLKLFLFDWQMDGKEAQLALGGYAKYYLSKDYFVEAEDDHFDAVLYGAELGVRVNY